jgi:hypothetical protein
VHLRPRAQRGAVVERADHDVEEAGQVAHAGVCLVNEMPTDALGH